MENEPSFLIIENKRATPSGFLGDTVCCICVRWVWGALHRPLCPLIDELGGAPSSPLIQPQPELVTPSCLEWLQPPPSFTSLAAPPQPPSGSCPSFYGMLEPLPGFICFLPVTPGCVCSPNIVPDAQRTQ